MFPCQRLNSKWPLKRGRAPYIAGKEVQLGVVGARGRLEQRRRERCRVGSGLSQDGAKTISSLHRRTNYFHHCTSLQSPTASEQLAEVRAYNGQQVNKRTMYRKCTKSVQKMHKICTAAAQWPEHTGVEWGGPCVPILLSSLVSQIPRLSVFTIFQLPFNCRLSDHPVCQFSITFQL